MSDLTRFREIEVAGAPVEMGRAIGEAARQEIRGYAAIVLERVNLTVRVSRERALSVARDSFPFVAGYAPHMLEELRGMAEGSGLPVEELMLLQVRNQLVAEGDSGCTSFSIAPPAGDRAVVGQNWDNDPATDPYTVVLTRRPNGRPAHMTITQAGLIAYIGMNRAGLGVCLNTLPAPARPLGVPHYFTVRGILESDSLDAAVLAVSRAERAIPANIMLATPQGPADLEVTPEDVHVLRDGGRGLVTHTNHCEHPDLLPHNDRFPELIQSRPRKARMERLIGQADRTVTLEDMKRALRDHENHPTSICRHVNDHPVTGYWATTFSVLMETETGLMHVSRGNPCEKPYETYRLT